jgi:hypothetical protein
MLAFVWLNDNYLSVVTAFSHLDCSLSFIEIVALYDFHQSLDDNSMSTVQNLR